MSADRLYTTNQLAKLFGVVPTTVIDWIEAGKLDAFKTLGGHRRITHHAVLEFLRKNKLSTPPAFTETRKKLLLLDDQQEVLTMFERILKKKLPDVDIILVDHPVDALVQIGAEKPRLVVFDIYMPDMDGFEFCRRLRETQNADIKLVAISGESVPETGQRVLEAGADHFLPKTEAIETLGDLCESLL